MLSIYCLHAFTMANPSLPPTLPSTWLSVFFLNLVSSRGVTDRNRMLMFKHYCEENSGKIKPALLVILLLDIIWMIYSRSFPGVKVPEEKLLFCSGLWHFVNLSLFFLMLLLPLPLQRLWVPTELHRSHKSIPPECLWGVLASLVDTCLLRQGLTM